MVRIDSSNVCETTARIVGSNQQIILAVFFSSSNIVTVFCTVKSILAVKMVAQRLLDSGVLAPCTTPDEIPDHSDRPGGVGMPQGMNDSRLG